VQTHQNKKEKRRKKGKKRNEAKFLMSLVTIKRQSVSSLQPHHITDQARLLVGSGYCDEI